MADHQEESWAPFDDEEEAPSLSDLPVASDEVKPSSMRREEAINAYSSTAADFEFRSWSNDTELDMCAADEVFYEGRILPLRPSVSSDGGGVLRRRSDSVSSLGFASGRSNSTSSLSSSGGRISRSHSSSSASSDAPAPAPRWRAPDGFYMSSSPGPQLVTSRRSHVGRKSGGSPGWTVLRLGVARAPEIELRDLRARRARPEKKAARGSERGSKEEEKRAPGLLLGFGCKCSPEAVKSSSRVSVAKKKKEGVELKRGASIRHIRVFEWLEELSIAKASVA